MATGVSFCRLCGETKPLDQFYSHHATCIVCCRKKSLAYKRKTRALYMRERRLSMLGKYLTSSCVAGECPICGRVDHHDLMCSLDRLRRDLQELGWRNEPAV